MVYTNRRSVRCFHLDFGVHVSTNHWSGPFSQGDPAALVHIVGAAVVS